MLDPSQRDCLGKYGFGDGYAFDDDVTVLRMIWRLGVPNGHGPERFCMRCPAHDACMYVTYGLRRPLRVDLGLLGSFPYDANWSAGYRAHRAPAKPV